MNIEEKVIAAINKKISREPHIRRDNVFYASEAGGCSRKIYYSFVQHKPIDGLYGTFQLGNQIHMFIKKYFKMRITFRMLL